MPKGRLVIHAAHSRYRTGKCQNALTITGSDDDMIAIMIALRGCEDLQHKNHATDGGQPLALNAFVPVPDHIKGSFAVNRWAKDNWGVRYGAWDVLLESDGGALLYNLTTFGGPPQVWVRTLSERFPQVQIQLKYEENYYPFAQGEFLYQDGKYLRSFVSVMSGEQDRPFAARRIMVDRGAAV